MRGERKRGEEKEGKKKNNNNNKNYIATNAETTKNFIIFSARSISQRRNWSVFMKGCSMTGASFEEDHYALLSAWRNLTVDKVSVAVRMKAVRSVAGCNQEDA